MKNTTQFREGLELQILKHTTPSNRLPMYCNPCYKWTPSDDNREIDSPVYCNPWSGWTISYTEKMIHLCIATLHLTEQLDTTEKMIHLCIATPDMTEEHTSTTPEKSAYLFVAPPWYDWRTSQYNTWEVSVPVYCLPLVWLKNIPVQHLRSRRTCVLPSAGMTEEHPSTILEKWAYLCVAFPWYDWRTSQYNTSEVSVPVYCLPLFPRGHCRSVSASRWPSRWSLHLGWQTNWWRQESLKDTDQKKAIFIKRCFHMKKTNRQKRLCIILSLCFVLLVSTVF